jgi:endoglucanase
MKERTMDMGRSRITMLAVGAAVAVGTLLSTGAAPAVAGPRAAVGLPKLRINDIQTLEGNSGMHAVTFKVRLSAPSGSVVTVALDTVDKTATEGKDYLGTSRTLTFQPGQTKVTVDIEILGDVKVEPDETFYGFLSSVSGATIAKAKGWVTIVNDD